MTVGECTDFFLFRYYQRHIGLSTHTHVHHLLRFSPDSVLTALLLKLEQQDAKGWHLCGVRDPCSRRIVPKRGARLQVTYANGLPASKAVPRRHQRKCERR